MSGIVFFDPNVVKTAVEHQLTDRLALVLADLKEDGSAGLEKVHRVRKIAFVEIEPGRSAVQRKPRLEILHARI